MSEPRKFRTRPRRFVAEAADFVAPDADLPLVTVKRLYNALDAARAELAALREERDRLDRDYAELVEHHRKCEIAGTRLADLVKRETGVNDEGPPVEDNVLIEAAQAWDEHQWPDLAALSPAVTTGEET